MPEPLARSALSAWRPTACLALAVLAPALLRGEQVPQARAPSVRLSPETLRMGTFYGGATVRIEGEAPPGTTPLVVIRGPEEAEFFNRKGRVGPVWLSVEKVQVTRAPSLFIRLGGGDILSLLDPTVVEAHRLDDSAIEHSMSVRKGCGGRVAETATHGAGPVLPCPGGVELEEGQARPVRSAYLDLKRQEGTYQAYPDAVRLDASGEGETRYAAELAWPRKARPGLYQVEVFVYRNRAVVGQASTSFPVVQTGVPARIGALATSHPTVYGAFAVLAAVVTGLTMDFLVRRRRPHGVGRGLRSRPPAAARAAEPAAAPVEEAPVKSADAVEEEKQLTGMRG
jgi:hypothetical protein